MQYFSKKGTDYSAKNSLQEFVLTQLKQFDHLLIDSPKKFEQDVKAMVKKANHDYPRCTPLQVSTWTSPNRLFAFGQVNNTPDKHLKIGDLAQFNLYRICGHLTGEAIEDVQAPPNAEASVQLSLNL